MVFREYSTQGRRWLVAGGHTPQRSLQSLVCPLHLPVGLGEVPRGQTNRGPNPAAEGLPDLGRELGSTVGDDVDGNTMEPDHVGHKEVRSLSRGREFREGGEVNHLGESVDHGQDGGIALGRGKACNEVQGNVGL